jgi:hypothetical protein
MVLKTTHPLAKEHGGTVENKSAAVNQRLAKWLKWLPVIRRDVEGLIVAKHIFSETQAVIAGNPKLRQPSTFYEFFANAYASHAVIGVRQLKSNDQSISFAKLLEEMIATPTSFTRSYYVSLYRKSVVERFANKDFNRFARPDAPHIDPGLVAEDLGRLMAAFARCEEYADRRVAHLDRRAPKQVPTYNEVDACIDALDEMYVKYHLLFTAEAMESLLPTWQYDWQGIFRVAWLAPEDERPRRRNLKE